MLHGIEREIAVLPLTQRSIEWSPETKRGRALIEVLMVVAQMMSKRLRRSRKYLLFSTNQVRVCTMAYLRHIHLVYPLMCLELTIEKRNDQKSQR